MLKHCFSLTCFSLVSTKHPIPPIPLLSERGLPCISIEMTSPSPCLPYRAPPPPFNLCTLTTCTFVYRPRLRPFNDTTLQLLYCPDHHHNTLCICCLSCSCPCPAPRVYPLPARTSRRLRGGRQLAVTVTSFKRGGGSPWIVTGPLHDLHVLLCFFLFLLVHSLGTCSICTRYAGVTPRPPGVTGMLLTRHSLH
jgi:hypothetical protein